MFTRALSVLAVVSLLASCGDKDEGGPDGGTAAGADAASVAGADASTQQGASLVGTWRAGSHIGTYSNGFPSWVILAGGTWTQDFDTNGTNEVTGTWSVSGNEVTLTDTGGVEACSSSVVGVYTFTVTATTLTLQNVSDTCLGRQLGAQLTWTRQ